MDVGGAAIIGIHDDFVDQLHHGAVLFAHSRFGLFDVFGFCLQLGQDFIDPGGFLFIGGKKLDEIQDILF